MLKRTKFGVKWQKIVYIIQQETKKNPRFDKKNLCIKIDNHILQI